MKFSPEVPVWSGSECCRWTGCAAAHDTGCTRWTGTSRRLRRTTPWCWSPSETDAPGPTDRRTAGVWVFQVICRWDCSDLISVHLSASVHSYIHQFKHPLCRFFHIYPWTRRLSWVSRPGVTGRCVMHKENRKLDHLSITGSCCLFELHTQRDVMYLKLRARIHKES